jgi:hypothetical protein
MAYESTGTVDMRLFLPDFRNPKISRSARQALSGAIPRHCGHGYHVSNSEKGNVMRSYLDAIVCTMVTGDALSFLWYASR